MNAEDPIRTYLRVWIALLSLVALTVASAFIHFGTGNLVINLGLAVTKALLVIFFFMHLRGAGGTLLLVAATGFVWLLLLVGLSLTDLLTRSPVPPPW